MPARTHITTRSRSSGLTIIEILVGVAIGLIGIVAIFQAVAVWSKHTQSISSGGDAQIAGTLALFNIERDLKQAGHGFGRATMQVMGCPVDATGTAPFQMRAVDIAASAGGRPDRINVLYGNWAGQWVPFEEINKSPWNLIPNGEVNTSYNDAMLNETGTVPKGIWADLDQLSQ